MRNIDGGGLSPTHVSTPRGGFLVPGYVAVLAAYCHKNGLKPEQCDLCQSHFGYLEAIAFQREVFGEDAYPHQRWNEGATYSPLCHLNNPDQVDEASGKISGCIRRLAGTSPGVRDLVEVVGELHDNVWSHGMDSGFSIAQTWKVPFEEDRFIEFGLADVGIGFLRELTSHGVNVDGDRAAIEWALQEGHSTKGLKIDDPWAQSLPDDAVGNPFSASVPTTKGAGGNHHLGLGLAKLVSLVTRYKGTLYIASGDSILVQGESGEWSWLDVSTEWQGVAVACRLRQSRLNDAREPTGESTDEVDAVAAGLSGGWKQ